MELDTRSNKMKYIGSACLSFRCHDENDDKFPVLSVLEGLHEQEQMCAETVDVKKMFMEVHTFSSSTLNLEI